MTLWPATKNIALLIPNNGAVTIAYVMLADLVAAGVVSAFFLSTLSRN